MPNVITLILILVIIAHSFYLWRHINDPIPAKQTNENIVIFSLYFAFGSKAQVCSSTNLTYVFIPILYISY